MRVGSVVGEKSEREGKEKLKGKIGVGAAPAAKTGRRLQPQNGKKIRVRGFLFRVF